MTDYMTLRTETLFDIGASRREAMQLPPHILFYTIFKVDRSDTGIGLRHL